MLGGVVVQLGKFALRAIVGAQCLTVCCSAAITIYVTLAAEFLVRFHLNRPLRGDGRPSASPRTLDKNSKLMLLALSYSTLTIFIRYVVPIAVSRALTNTNAVTGLCIVPSS